MKNFCPHLIAWPTPVAALFPATILLFLLSAQDKFVFPTNHGSSADWAAVRTSGKDAAKSLAADSMWHRMVSTAQSSEKENGAVPMHPLTSLRAAHLRALPYRVLSTSSAAIEPATVLSAQAIAAPMTAAPCMRNAYARYAAMTPMETNSIFTFPDRAPSTLSEMT